MSVLQSKDVQIWNNAAFDDSHLNHQDSLAKENRSPKSMNFNSSVSLLKSQLPLRQIHPNGVLEMSNANSRMDPDGVFEVSRPNSRMDSNGGFEVSKHSSRMDSNGGFEVSKHSSRMDPNGVFEVSRVDSRMVVKAKGVKEIDKEIEEIELEMSRLASRLEALKAQKIVKGQEKRGKLVSAKFMDQKKGEEKEIVSMSAKSKGNGRRGVSLGPVEISAGARRGMSLGPSEIGWGLKSKQFGKQDFSTTPVQAMQNRRKSCFWKLEDIDEEREAKGKGKHQFLRQAVTTIGTRKSVKIDDGMISSVQPKKLFGNGEKSVVSSAKKTAKQGRVVPSRYNQISSYPSSAIRKRSLPENDCDESKKCDKKRSLSPEKKKATVEEKKNVDTQSRIKKRWEIPSEIVIHGSYDDEKSPQSVSVMHDLLPKLRVRRGVRESPRDSGPAKKVAELVGRKSFFSSDEEMEQPVCQALSFAEAGDEE